jgi:uncharacterized protein YgfB (UPF0149 family)
MFALVWADFLAVVSWSLSQTPLERVGSGFSATVLPAVITGLIAGGRGGLAWYGALAAISAG